MAVARPRRTMRGRFVDYVDRLSRLRNMLERELHVESITGADKTVDVVVDIFNRVNSGGTKLSKGDLALARICAEWARRPPDDASQPGPLARARACSSPRTGCCATSTRSPPAVPRSPPSKTSPPRTSSDALGKAVHNVDHLLDLLASALGLDHDRVLMGRYAICRCMARLL